MSFYLYLALSTAENAVWLDFAFLLRVDPGLVHFGLVWSQPDAHELNIWKLAQIYRARAVG